MTKPSAPLSPASVTGRPANERASEISAGPVVLYDGRCGLCSRSIAIVVRRDRRAIFRFAALDGAFAAGALARQGFGDAQGPALAPDAVALVEWPGTARERIHFRSEAVLRILARLPLPFCLGALALRMIPRRLRDAAYDRIARLRYRVFGAVDACAVPAPELQSRFLD